MSPLGPELNEVITTTIAYLVRHNVKDESLSRLALKTIAQKKDTEASYERGMADNYSSAPRLNWEADMHRLAAETRFPILGDSATVHQYSRIIAASLVHFVQNLVAESENDEDGVTYTRIHQSIEEAIDLDNVPFMQKVIEQLASKKFLSEGDVPFWQEEYASRNPVYLEMSRQKQEAAAARARLENVTTPKINEVVKSAIVCLLRDEKIPLSKTRDEIMAKAREISQEGSVEASWDNYSTAARLQFKASVYRLAAEVRYPREGDMAIRVMRSRLEEAILREVIYDEPCEDAAESTRVDREMRMSAIYRAASFDDVDFMNELIDEFSERGDIENPSEVKEEIKNRLEFKYQNENNSVIEMKM